MHTVTHALAHRGTPAARTRVRWQPYNTIQSSISSRSPAPAYPITPASSVSSSPGSSRLCEIERFGSSSTPSVIQTPRDATVREVHKTKYAIGLVDKTVTTLCEIWHPQDIPAVFLTSSRANVVLSNAKEPPPPVNPAIAHLWNRNSQLPSPTTPTTQASPFSPPSTPSTSATSSSAHARPLDPLAAGASMSAHSNLIPLRGFVHEVLRRSRTSGSVLQTALCYLVAIRAKVPELVRQEKAGEGVRGEKDSSERIIQGETGNECEMGLEGVTNTVLESDGQSHDEIAMDTLADGAVPIRTTRKEQGSQTFSKKAKTPSPPLPPLPPLPSPLLCPRRAFLASLILASKFTQDRCYSNRAWAKLSGLPPREIGRCERALGDALQWRLWVGKSPSSPASPTPTGRQIVRCRSESDLATPPADILAVPAAPIGAAPMTDRGLKRASTLPASSYIPTPESLATASFAHGYGAARSEWHTSGSTLSASAYSAPDSTSDQRLGRSFTSGYQTESSAGGTPPTPTLSLSPSSTDSSGGDRTVQMSSFIDITTPPSNCAFASLGTAKVPSSPLSSCGIFSYYTSGDMPQVAMLGSNYAIAGNQNISIVEPMYSY